jgi:hypothetical protein
MRRYHHMCLRRLLLGLHIRPPVRPLRLYEQEPEDHIRYESDTAQDDKNEKSQTEEAELILKRAQQEEPDRRFLKFLEK